MSASAKPQVPLSHPPAPGNPSRRVTLSDIAASLGISTMSVSRALRNQPRTSALLRERVLNKAKEMGYRPDPALSALVQYRQGKASTSINAVLAWFNQWPEPKKLRDFREFDLYWRGAQASAEKLGFRLEEFVVNDAMPPDRMKTILRTRDIRGILIPPGPFNRDWMGRFDWTGFSLVGMTKMPESLPIHSVTSHQVHNVMRAMTEMRALGYGASGSLPTLGPLADITPAIFGINSPTPTKAASPPACSKKKTTKPSCPASRLGGASTGPMRFSPSSRPSPEDSSRWACACRRMSAWPRSPCSIAR